jgi:hypothetical protein
LFIKNIFLPFEKLIINLNLKIMKNYQILISGYRNGYLTTEIVNVRALTLEQAEKLAEKKSYLDGASAV